MDIDRIHRLMDSGCSCHQSPPCTWCMSLTETEADIFWDGGRKALDDYWKRLINDSRG